MMKPDLTLARETLDTGHLAFVLVCEGHVIASGQERGVATLLAAVDRLGADVCGASLADKVVGKAVALIVAHTGIVAVDARLASDTALSFLRARGIPIHCDQSVPQILNRRGDGPCPMEKLTQAHDDPAEGMARLREFVASMG